ncbi:MAG: hypothetical protein QM648_07325 [Solirubrobacterales bacterium]
MYLDRSTGKLWLTPSDVTDYLGSQWLFAQRLAVARGDRVVWKSPDSGTAEITARRGQEHERAYLKRLESEGRTIVKIPRATTQEEWKAAVAQTAQAMSDESVDVIYQAHLTLDETWRGQADFLERNDDGVFEPVDTKLARSVKPYMVIQLGFYSDALRQITGELPPRFHVVLGDGARATEATNDFIHFTRETLGAVEDFAADAEALAATYPWPAEALALAGLDAESEAIRRADDHLTLIAGITRKQIERLAERGITTCAELARAAPDERPEKMADSTTSA